MGSEQVAQVLRKVGQHVKLVIARLVTDESNVDASSREEVFVASEFCKNTCKLMSIQFTCTCNCVVYPYLHLDPK